MKFVICMKIVTSFLRSTNLGRMQDQPSKLNPLKRGVEVVSARGKQHQRLLKRSVEVVSAGGKRLQHLIKRGVEVGIEVVSARGKRSTLKRSVEVGIEVLSTRAKGNFNTY